MKAAQFEYHRPSTVAEAIELLAALAPLDGRIIAGGQSLVPMMAYRLARPAHLIDINRIPGLDAVTRENGKLRIGATVRHAAMERNKNPSRLEGFLGEVAHHIAHAPIRTRGTVCGSIANSDPASEWCLLAATLDAEIVGASKKGMRTLAANTFFEGPMSNALASDEMIIEVRFPDLEADARCGFYEVSRVAGGFAMAAAAVTYRLEGGRVVAPRLGVGGVESAPRRITAAEAAMDGTSIDKLDIAAVADAAAADVDPMEDAQYDATFKRDLARAVVRRALERSLA